MNAPASASPTYAQAWPQRVGRYQLLTPLGSGGAATVYLARRLGPGGFERHVAVKVLHPHLRADPDCVSDFLREARLAALIRHPHVLPILEVDEDETHVFCVMEWVDGASLAELLTAVHDRNQTLPTPIALRLMVDALAGLHAAHEAVDSEGVALRLVHRDVSPHNLLLAANGNVVLADFGIAKATAKPGHTRTGVVKGKLAYMAPEQLRSPVIDRRADVWAMGLVSWEMLAGRRAIVAETEGEVALLVSEGKVPHLSTVRPDLPAALCQVVHSALCPVPGDRWATADVFRKQLLASVQDVFPLADADAVGSFLMETMGDEIAARKERLRSPAKEPFPMVVAPAARAGRHRIVPWWALAVGLLAMVGLAGLWILRGSARIRPESQSAAQMAPAAESPSPEPSPSPSAVQTHPAPPTAAAGGTPASREPPAKPGVRRHRRSGSAKTTPPESPSGPTVPPLADNPYQAL